METPTPPEDVARLRHAIERADPPAALRLRVDRQIAQARKQRARRLTVSVGGLAAVVALAAIAAVVVVPRGSVPSIAHVVRVAAEAPTAPAPAIDPANPGRLTAHVGDISFPSWRDVGWRAVARSSTTVSGRDALTVYYGRADGARLAYTIVGRTLPWPQNARAVTNGWTQMHVYEADGRRVLTWRWRGHQCVMAAPRSLPQRTLLALAASET